MYHVIRGWDNFFSKFIAFMLLCLFPSINGYGIVFVHIGKALPNYLIDAVHQARLFNAHAEIIVIAEQKAIDDANESRFLEEEVVFVPCESLKATDAHHIFLNKTSLDTKFREGFWRNCTERFYFIEELMHKYNLTDIFHLEYDNMLYVDLQELLAFFHLYPNIAATFDNDDRCIPGFVYFAHAQAAAKLTQHITDMCDSGLNDMQVIARYRKKCGETEIGTLPIIMPAYAQKYELKTATGFSVVSPAVYSAHFEEFNSIFDAAALGQYLGGIDPRNGVSMPGFINESCVFNSSRMTFRWIKDSKNRSVPYIIFDRKQYRINNLHIHCKNLKKFAS